MQRHHLKHATFVAVRGVLLISTAVALQWGKYLVKPESLLYDQRVVHCQSARSLPDESLVHLDIDDGAISNIGNFPWPRSQMAQIVDEIGLAQPKVVEFDYLYAEPQKIEYSRMDAVGVDGDQLLADAISKLKCGVVPVSATFEAAGKVSDIRRIVLPLLVENPERTEASCLQALRERGITDNFQTHSDDSFYEIRDEAFYERIMREANTHGDTPAGRAAIRRIMLPNEDPLLTTTVLGNVFDKQYNRAMAERAMLRFTLPVPKNGPPLLHPSAEIAPILPIGKAAGASGFVDYLPSSVQGAVRSVPLLAEYRGRLIPQVDLATACKMLGTDLNQIRVSKDSIVIPRHGARDVVIPVSMLDSNLVGSVGTLMEVPLFGNKNDWLTMYDVPRYEKQARHISAYEVWRICQTSQKLNTNLKSEDQQLRVALDLADSDDRAAYDAAPPTGEAKKQFVKKVLRAVADFVQTLAPDAGSDPTIMHLLQQAKTAGADLQLIAEQNDRLELQLSTLRKQLYEELHDNAVFFGGTATGLKDLQPTSLFYQCPGIVIHGAIYNAIMTGKMWRVVHPSWGVALTAALGILTLLLVTTLSPLHAFFGSIALALGYLAFNGYYLFAYKDLIVAAAGPLVAVALVYTGMTLTSFLTERAKSLRIEKRFQVYVDPNIVKYIVDHPEHVRFDGEKREITTCFSDLAGFTTLTDQMGERIVPLLSEYMSVMIPVIRRHTGYVSQMAGDGIYFFFGAPIDLPNHAESALNTVFGMYDALAAFNVTLKSRGLAQLGMRIGMATGEVIVGDTGAADASAYTAMGGTVNLSARLEPANKVFGSRMLITNRTVELLNGKYLVRPLANLRVAGKLNSVVVYEPLCLMSQATDADKRLAEYTTRVFEAYRVANFNRCIAAAVELEEAFGASKFTKLYTRLSTEHLNRTSPMEHYEGQIILTEK
jgi:class 3 adenylate cyclase/CHASE2 domain-containing sensor protein